MPVGIFRSEDLGNDATPRRLRLNSFWEYLGHYGMGVALLPVPVLVAYSQFYLQQPNVWKADPFMAFLFAAGVYFCVQQWRALRCDKVATHHTAQANYKLVFKLFRRLGWGVRRKKDGYYIQAVSPYSCTSNGEAVTVFFEGSDVYVNSIYDPQSKNGGGRGKRNRRNMQAVERLVTH